MRANHVYATFALFAAAVLSQGAAARPAPKAATQPFSVQDLVRLDRISELAVSPDGKRVAYTVRTTDMDANKGRTSIWVLDARKRNAAAVRISDLSANSNAAAWSGDGRFVYYLSNRSGTTQVWRAAAGGEPLQVTNLPLDVGSFRVSPRADRLLVSIEVYRDCSDLACTKARLDTAARSAARGILYDRIFVRHWDAWSDGRRSQLFSIALDDAGPANGTPVNLTAGIDGDVPGKPFGDRADYSISPDGKEVAFSVRGVPVGEPWSTNYDIYTVPAGGGTPHNVTADNPAWDGQPSYSPDGSVLAYLAMDRPGFEADRFHLMLLNLKTGGKTALTKH
jgi:dipeptidyl aminopeptidase/acylaminoacyl peptidase